MDIKILKCKICGTYGYINKDKIIKLLCKHGKEGLSEEAKKYNLIRRSHD